MTTEVKNRWETERLALSHTYLKHHFQALIHREAFAEACLRGDFDDPQIGTVITNFKRIEEKTRALLAWAVPFACEHTEIALLSQLYGESLDPTQQATYRARVDFFSQRCRKRLERYIRQIEQTLTELKSYVHRLQKRDPSIDEDFVVSFRLAAQAFASSLKSIKHIAYDIEEEETKPLVLVIDDHYAADSAANEADYYDKNYFLNDFRSSQYAFAFSTAFDRQTRRYSVKEVERHIKRMPRLPDVILLDVMFGDDEYLGMEILSWLSNNYATVPVVMMTSKGKSELLAPSIEKGAVDYLVKPFSREELRQTVMRYTNHSDLLLGQGALFLSRIREVTHFRGNIAIHTDDTLRAKSFIAYYARVCQKTLTVIDVLKNDVKTQLMGEGVYFLENLSYLSLQAQEGLYNALKHTDGTIQVCAVLGEHVVHQVKQHRFDPRLYASISQNNITLEGLDPNSLDMVLIFRYALQRKKPRHTKTDITVTQALCKEVFAYKLSYTTQEIDAFVDALYAKHKHIDYEILRAFSIAYHQRSENYSFETLRDRLSALKCEELDILLIALQKTMQEGKRPNKTKALRQLLGKEKVSTNEYDRWFKKIWKEIPKERQEEYRKLNLFDTLNIKV